ncbi:hypothetical protein KL86DPRO_10553 [uncultured delta proteobacterium]|uniref:Uncharacterized protein n=1 Tax=uncultured delta proteobacterium TaxID=34034 RepID=A0A212J257_9DELT|nr:hypothetical protein KL86DPRO_10553 [uncultured delta proteobacterium]
MRDYSKISPQFWYGRTGKEMRKLGASTQFIALYLLTNRHVNMLGLYNLPMLYIAADTGIAQEAGHLVNVVAMGSAAFRPDAVTWAPDCPFVACSNERQRKWAVRVASLPSHIIGQCGKEGRTGKVRYHLSCLRGCLFATAQCWESEFAPAP